MFSALDDKERDIVTDAMEELILSSGAKVI